MAGILPWQQETWRQLWRSHGLMPHSMLLIGAEGIGKSQFAQSLAQRLLCETQINNADALACSNCPSCKLFSIRNHPDFRWLVPASSADEPTEAVTKNETNVAENSGKAKKQASSQILIGQIRELNDFVFVSSHRGGRRVVLIEPAQKMNAVAANALLKILEEPPDGVFFILVSSQWRRLPPTILSRCLRVPMPKPTQQQASSWLADQPENHAASLLTLCGGAPLLAQAENKRRTVLEQLSASLIVNQNTNFLSLASYWEGLLKSDPTLNMSDIVLTMQKAVYDWTLLSLGQEIRFMDASASQLNFLCQRLQLPRLLALYKILLRARSLADHPLNTRLMLDDLASRYLQIFGLV